MARLLHGLSRLGAALALCVAGGAWAAGQEQGAPPANVAAPPAATPSPAPGRVDTFENWAMACDNVAACTAVPLLAEEAAEPYDVLLALDRAGGPRGEAQLRILADQPLRGRIDILADGVRIAQLRIEGDSAALKGEPARAAIRALGSSFALEIRLGRQTLARPLLAGLPAALRAMDERQGRVGSADALAALGDGDPAAVRAAPPAPQLSAPLPDSALVASPLTPREEAEARRLAVCSGEAESSYAPDVYALDKAATLVLIPCDTGAYNVSMVPLVGTGAAGERSFAIARFDHMPGFTGEPGMPPLIVNARWNPQLGELSSFAKGRGLGDCGTAEDYLWDGRQFRLVEARAMPVCRGAWEWPRIWTAQRAPASTAAP